MSVPDELKYTAEHEWAQSTESGAVRVGITDHAQEQLGDIVFVSLPQPGDKVVAGSPCGELESTKSVSEIYAPVSGEIVAANGELGGAPEKVNEDAFAAWMFRIKPDNAADLDKLLDAAAYERAAS